MVEVVACTGEGGGRCVEACDLAVGPTWLSGGAGPCHSYSRRSKGMDSSWGRHMSPLWLTNAMQAAGERDQRNKDDQLEQRRGRSPCWTQRKKH